MRGAVFLPALLQEALGRGMRRVSGVDIPLYKLYIHVASVY